ncbi:hypothetical protein NSA50_16825 [Clostridium sp. DSM 100503]|uniref:hypothetical protein n=1 Tax=Clostridium sp. DSM 100503 TaxID=2963282 RepID=UPI00214A5D62|nr:hypothetical protein [Clostridium sp. DSM 100503]MCR1952691.1 hypothetical protein [Clostridium sp. DSM 100503]
MEKILLIVILFIIISFGILILVNKNLDNGIVLRIVIFFMKKLQHENIIKSRTLLYLIQTELGGAVEVLYVSFSKVEIEYIKQCYDILTDFIYESHGNKIKKEKDIYLNDKLEYIDFDKIREALLIKLRNI